MQSYAIQSVLAVCLVVSTWCVSQFGFNSLGDSTTEPTLSAASNGEADILDLRTGDTFWGLHLDSVVPCSSLLVRGGGDLVTFSVMNNHNARCGYHVVKEKQIILHGNEFSVRVVGADQIHVERIAVSKDIATMR